MASTTTASFFFLYHKDTVSPEHDRQLSTAARVHVSRQAQFRLVRRPRTLKFIAYSPDIGDNLGDSPLSTESNDSQEKKCAPAAVTDAGRANGHADSTRLPPIPAILSGLDPFDSGAVSAPTHDEQFLLDYAFRRMIPSWGESDDKKHDFSQSWIWNVLESPPVFYSQIVGSYIHYSICCPTDDRLSRLLKTALRKKIQAIRALRAKVEQYKAGSPDIDRDMIPAMFILAVHGSADISVRPEPHPLSPLATLREFHIYGRMKFVTEHVNALYYLLQQKGGICNTDQSSVGYVLPLLDLHYSVRNESRPMFSCARQLETILRGDLWKPDMEATQMLTTMTEALRPTPGGGASWADCLAPNVVKILQVMIEITVALDHYCRGGQGAPNSLNVLLNNCDWVTHTLLSIPSYLQPASYMSDSEQQQSGHHITTYLREITRLCALLYTDMVIFPTPPHTGIKLRISTRILRLMEVIQQESFAGNGSFSEFLTWATVLGAIGARFSDLRVPYCNLIKRIARDTDWDKIHPRLKRYLWFGSVCDGPASSLWLEARIESRHAETTAQR